MRPGPWPWVRWTHFDKFLAQRPAGAGGLHPQRGQCLPWRQAGAVGVSSAGFRQNDLFRGVMLGGMLTPKKTFSMDHAEEKAIPGMP